MAEEISRQFTEAERALDERVSDLILAPKWTPSPNAPVDHAYALMKEDLKFQSALSSNLKEQQSVVYAQAARRDLHERARRSDANVEKAQKANAHLIALMDKEKLSFEAATREVLTIDPTLPFISEWSTAHEKMKATFEDDDAKAVRESAERLGVFARKESELNAKEKEHIRGLKMKDMEGYYQELSESEEMRRNTHSQKVIKSRLDKIEGDQDRAVFFASEGLSAKFRGQVGGNVGEGARKSGGGDAEGISLSISDINRVVLDSHMSRDEQMELSGFLETNAGFTVDNPAFLLSHINHDAETGFIMRVSEYAEYEEKRELETGDVQRAIQTLGDEDINKEAARLGTMDSDPARDLQAARRILRGGGYSYHNKHRDHLKGLKAKAEEEAAEKIKQKEIEALQTKAQEIAKDVSEEIADIDNAIMGGNITWTSKWGQGTTNADGVPDVIAAKEENYDLINHTLDKAWTAGAAALSEIMRQYHVGERGKPGRKVAWTERELLEIFDERLRMTAQDVLGLVGEVGLPQQLAYPLMSPAGYSREIRSFINEVIDELNKPVLDQRLIVPFEHRVAPNRIEQFKARGGETTDKGVPVRKGPRRTQIKIRRGEHDPKWGYIFQEGKKEDKGVPSAVPPPVGSPVGTGDTHTVVKQESISSIASQHGLESAALLALNPQYGGDPLKLKVGDNLILKEGATPGTPGEIPAGDSPYAGVIERNRGDSAEGRAQNLSDLK